MFLNSNVWTTHKHTHTLLPLLLSVASYETLLWGCWRSAFHSGGDWRADGRPGGETGRSQSGLSSVLPGGEVIVQPVTGEKERERESEGGKIEGEILRIKFSFSGLFPKHSETWLMFRQRPPLDYNPSDRHSIYKHKQTGGVWLCNFKMMTSQLYNNVWWLFLMFGRTWFFCFS